MPVPRSLAPRTPRRLAPFIAAVAAALSLGAAAAAEKRIPALLADDVQIAAHIADLAALREQGKAHPFAEALSSEAKRKMRGAAEALTPERGDDASSGQSFRETLNTEFGLTVDELFELFPGEAAIAVSGLDAERTETADGPSFVLVAEYAGQPSRLHELLRVQFERNAEAQKKANPQMEHTLLEERFMGETLYLDEAFDGETSSIEDGYALVNGYFVLARPEARLRSAVEWIKAGPERPWAETEGYLRALEESPGPVDALLHVDLASLARGFRPKVVEALGRPPFAALGNTPERMYEALGLEAMNALFLTADLRPNDLLLAGGLTFDEPRGLLALLSYAEGPLPAPGIVPRDPLASNVSLFDLGGAWKAFERLLQDFSPALDQMVSAQASALSNKHGFDLRGALLRNFGGGTVSYAQRAKASGRRAGSGPAGAVHAFAIEDGQRLEKAIDALLGINPKMRSLFAEQDYQGRTIHYLDPAKARGGGEPSFAYVLTRSRLILGSGPLSLLKEALNRLESGAAGFWGADATRALFEPIARPNPIARSYSEASRFFDAFAQSPARAAADNEQKVRALASVKAPIEIVTEANRGDGGIFGRSLVRPKNGEGAP